jgi:hypothetical protein
MPQFMKISAVVEFLCEQTNKTDDDIISMGNDAIAKDHCRKFEHLSRWYYRLLKIET